LLTAAEAAEATPQQAAQHAALRKPPLVLDANPDVVLRALESHMQTTQATHEPAVPIA
jgi:threonine synthase